MLRAAIIGLGWWGRVLVEAVQTRSSSIRFVRGVTQEPHAAEGFAAHHGFPISSTLEDALSDPNVQAVVLATPHSQHVPQIIRAAEAGRHVFCEKPLALLLSDAVRAVEACRRAGVLLGLGNDKRFLPAVCALKRLVDSGELGDLLHVEGQYSNANMAKGLTGAWRSSSAETPGGGMTGPGLHVLDGLVNLAGTIKNTAARMHVRRSMSSAPSDSVAVLLEFSSGVTGTLATVRSVPDFFRLQAVGTHGWAEVNGFDALTVCLSTAEPRRQKFPSALAVGELLDAFSRAVAAEAPFPVSTASMLDTVAAFESVISSLASGQPVEVADWRKTESGTWISQS